MGRLLGMSHRIRVKRIRASKRLRTNVQLPSATRPAVCAGYGKVLPVDWDRRKCLACNTQAACFGAYDVALGKVLA